MKIVIRIILLLAIIALGYFLWKSIDDPIQFNKEKNKRFDAVIENLKEIRKAQLAYFDVHGQFTGSFDTLIHFIETDSLPMVYSEGQPADSLILALGMKDAELRALELGLIRRDTSKVSTLDSLFRDYDISKMRYVPYTDNYEYVMNAGEILTGSKVKVKVFEAKVPNHIILNGMDEQEIINLNEECEKLNRYKGLKVGSLDEATNHAGNWE